MSVRDLGFPQALSAVFANAENVGRHGKKIFHLLPFHGEGEPDGDGFHKGEARHVRDGVLGFFDKMGRK